MYTCVPANSQRFTLPTIDDRPQRGTVCPGTVKFGVSFSSKSVIYDIMIVTIIERMKWYK